MYLLDFKIKEEGQNSTMEKQKIYYNNIKRN